MAIPTQPTSGAHFSTPTYTPTPTISDTTRYLCCAPYLDTDFANRVIAEVVEDEQRAVPPSYGFDLDPVVRHCLRARRLLLARHAAVTALVVLGMLTTPLFTLAFLTLGGIALLGRRRQSGVTWGRIFGTIGVLVILSCIAGSVAGIIFTSLAYLEVSSGLEDLNGYGSGSDDGGYGLTSLIFFYANVARWLPLPLGVGTFLALFLFRRNAYQLLTSELAPHAPSSRPTTRSARVERRLAAVAAAQRGNITVQERNPFLGSGPVVHGWSFALALRAAVDSDEDDDGKNPRNPTGRVDVDGVELNRRVREAVLRLRDPELPENARVPAIFVTSNIVADGVRAHTDALINPLTRMPYTLASDAAIEAITRCPQGGLRRYERAVVPGAGKNIVTDDGRPVMPAQDLGIEVTAFTHFAVEGGMLYAEFLGAVLPPVRNQYTIADAIREDRVTERAFRDTLRTFLTDVVNSPSWLVLAGWQHLTLHRRMNAARRKSEEYQAHDYGARLSVRELAAEPDLTKFLHTLDGWKYVKLLDRAVADAAVEFLAEKGVDTTEFSTAVMYTRNEYSNVTNISGGQQNFGGANATFKQQNKKGRER